MKMSERDSSKRWASDFGREYTDRNDMGPNEMDSLYRDRYGISRTDLNSRFLKDVELGASSNHQLPPCLTWNRTRRRRL